MKNLNSNIYLESEVMLTCDLIDLIERYIEDLKNGLSCDAISLINDMLESASKDELYKLCDSLSLMLVLGVDDINMINTLVQADEINKIAFLDIEHHLCDYLTDYKFYDGMDLNGFAMYHLLYNKDIPIYVKDLISFERYKKMLIQDGLIASDYGVLYPR